MKKRKAMWIVGALVVALFAAGTLVMDYNSTDAKIERAIAQIVAEYGFERPDHLPGRRGKQLSNPLIDVYSSAPIEAETAADIWARLRDVCPSWENYYSLVYDHRSPHNLGYISFEVQNCIAPEQYDGRIAVIGFTADTNPAGIQEFEPRAFLILYKQVRPSPWERIKGIWPW